MSFRTAIVLIVSTMALVTEVIAPPLGSLIMAKTNPLIGFASAAAVEFSAILVLLFIPETLSTKPTGYESLPSQPIPTGSVDEHEDEIDITKPKYKLLQIISHKMHEISGSLQKAVRTVAGDWIMILTLPCFLTTEMGTELVTYMIQYTSVRFGWTLAAVCHHPLNQSPPFCTPLIR
jgi:hypothetical protein